MKVLGQGHTARKQLSWDSFPGLFPNPALFSLVLHCSLCSAHLSCDP